MQNAKRMIDENFKMINASDNPIEYNLCGAVKNLIAELENTQYEVQRLTQEVAALSQSQGKV